MVVRAAEGRLHGGLSVAARLAGVRQCRLAAEAARTWPRRAPGRAPDFLRSRGGLHPPATNSINGIHGPRALTYAMAPFLRSPL